MQPKDLTVRIEDAAYHEIMKIYANSKPFVRVRPVPEWQKIAQRKGPQKSRRR